MIKYYFLVLCCCLFGNNGFAQKSKSLTESERIKFDATFINGNKEKILENYDEALKLFAICYKLDPENAALNYIIGDTYFQKKDYVNAEPLVVAAVKLDNQNNWYKELLVDTYIAEKKNKEAAKLLVQIAHQKKEVEYLLKASYIYAIIGDYKNALKVLDDAEKKIGINEDIVTRKEQLYLAQNKTNSAIKEVEKLIKTYPTEPKYKGMLADLYWANGKPDKAVAIYKQILNDNPNNGFALFAMADYYRSVKDLDKWYEYLKRGMATTDVDVKAKLNVLSQFIIGKDFPNQSERIFELAQIFSATHQDEETAHLVLGDVYQQQLKFDSARIEYQKALAIEPATYIAWQQSVFCSSQLLNNNFILSDCENAISYFPNEVAFYVYGAVAATQLKQYNKTISICIAGLDITPPDQQDIIDQLRITLADTYHYTKNYSACDSVYTIILKADSNNAYALNNYAYFLSLRKTNLDKAAAMSLKSIELDGQNPSYLDTYGWILFVQGKYAQAKEYIQKSLTASPNNAEVIDHLGDVLYYLNDIEGALEQWKKAQQLGCENPVLPKKINDKKWYEQ